MQPFSIQILLIFPRFNCHQFYISMLQTSNVAVLFILIFPVLPCSQVLNFTVGRSCDTGEAREHANGRHFQIVNDKKR